MGCVAAGNVHQYGVTTTLPLLLMKLLTQTTCCSLSVALRRHHTESTTSDSGALCVQQGVEHAAIGDNTPGSCKAGLIDIPS